MTMTGWNESAEQARARWEAKHTATNRELTAAEIDRLSRPFPANRTREQREADLALVKKALFIQLGKPIPSPRKAASKMFGYGVMTTATVFVILWTIAQVIGR